MVLIPLSLSFVRPEAHFSWLDRPPRCRLRPWAAMADARARCLLLYSATSLAMTPTAVGMLLEFVPRNFSGAGNNIAFPSWGSTGITQVPAIQLGARCVLLKRDTQPYHLVAGVVDGLIFLVGSSGGMVAHNPARNVRMYVSMWHARDAPFRFFMVFQRLHLHFRLRVAAAESSCSLKVGCVGFYLEYSYTK